MHSNDVIGFSHSDGFVLCPTCAEYGEALDEGTENGHVQAFFASEEWDRYPTCDGCKEEIETSLTEEGQAWLADREEKEEDTEDE